jgi:Family of unknown function (DUF6049)
MVTTSARSVGHLRGAGRSAGGRLACLAVTASLLAVGSSIAAGTLATGAATTAGAETSRNSPGPSDGRAHSGTANARPPAIATGPDSVELLSQTPWVDPSSTQFQLHLKITAGDPANETLAVNVYAELSARSQFQATLGGEFYNSYYQPGGGPIPLTDLPRDPSGGVDVDIPVNQSSGVLSATGVYPVQVFLEEGGVAKGKPLITFITYAGKDISSLHLDASLVLPMVGGVQIGPTGVPGLLSASDAAVLQGDAAALARWHVPVTIRAAAPTLQSLAAGTPADRAAVVDLRDAVSGGDEVLPGTALPVDIPELVGSGLTNDLSAQLSSGDASLGRLLGVQPSLTTWASAGDIDPASVDALAGLGVKDVALPEADLSTLPLADQEFTFAQPTKLSVEGPLVLAVGADSELSARVGEVTPANAVLVANQFLAELAMIDLERPSDQRGVVIIPAPGVQVNPVFLSVLLAGLHDNPLVQGVPLQQVFNGVPLASSASGSGVMVRQLDEQSAPDGRLQGAGQLHRALADVAADGEVYGDQVALVKGLSQRLFVSLSSVFDPSQRTSIIAGVLRAAGSALGNVHLPPPLSITLTSRQGRLPLILDSTSTAPMRVRLVLTSEQLSFVPATFAEGSCVPANSEKSADDCQLTLSHPTTVLRIPVVVRAPGGLPLSLQVETPSGSMVLRSSTDSIRSTAISDVGWFLMVGSVLFLGVWWARNARHGRRARRLVPRPDDDADSSEPLPAVGGATVRGADGSSSNAPVPTAPVPGVPVPGAHNPAEPTVSAVPPGLAETSRAAPSHGGPGPAASGPGATSPVGMAPGLAVRAGRDVYPGKHVLRPPR